MGETKEGDNGIRNVVILGIAFMLLMASYIPMAGITKTIIESVESEDPSFEADGYISMFLTFAFFAVFNFVAPMIVTFLGVRTTMIVGSTAYGIFTASFLFPNKWLIYATSSLVGIAAAGVWVANGKYFTRCSTKDTIGRNMGVYWGIYAMGQLFGNSFIFWRFQGKNRIDKETRTIVLSMLTGIVGLSTLSMCFLGVPRAKKINDLEENNEGKQKSSKSFCGSLLEPFKLLGNKHMLLIIPSAMYNGMQGAFYVGIYPTAVGFSEAMGSDSRKFSGLSGILVGVGTLIGGSVFGIFGKKIVKNKRHFVVTIALIAHCTCAALVYLNLPNGSSQHPTSETSYFNPPSIPIVMVCAFLFGIGDGCLNPQIMAQVGVIWPDNPSAAVAIFRFTQAATSAGVFVLSTKLGLYKLLICLVAMGVVGTITFWTNERLIERKDKEKIVVTTQASEFEWKGEQLEIKSSNN